MQRLCRLEQFGDFFGLSVASVNMGKQLVCAAYISMGGDGKLQNGPGFLD